MIGHVTRTLLHCTLTTEGNISQKYMKHKRQVLDKEIGEPPARATRIRDGIATPDLETFLKGYDILKSSLIPSKTKEISFQILNRTLWSANKASKSGVAETADCVYCGRTETTEHMIIDCDNYAYLQWEILQEVLSWYLTNLLLLTRTTTGETDSNRGQEVSIKVTLTYLNIIYHKQIPQIRAYHLSSNSVQVTNLLIAEVKRDIYRRRTQHPPSNIGRVLELRRMVHISSVIKKTIQYLTYLSPYIWKNDIAALGSALHELTQ